MGRKLGLRGYTAVLGGLLAIFFKLHSQFESFDFTGASPFPPPNPNTLRYAHAPHNIEKHDPSCPNSWPWAHSGGKWEGGKSYPTAYQVLRWIFPGINKISYAPLLVIPTTKTHPPTEPTRVGNFILVGKGVGGVRYISNSMELVTPTPPK